MSYNNWERGVLSFKKFFGLKKTKDGHIILDEPIHFKNNEPTFRKTKDGHIILDEPIHFKMGQQSINTKERLKEDASDNKDHLKAAIEYNDEKHGSDDNLSRKLHKATADDLDDESKDNIRSYTGSSKTNGDQTGSYSLNSHLSKGHKPKGDDLKMHSTIMKHAKPSGHEFHTFSGTSRDFSEIAKNSKDGIIHSPAHTSVTHDPEVAKDFADRKFNRGTNLEAGRHLIHIHVKPHDKILHVSQHSEHRTEAETIIPAGTKLKYHHTSIHTHDGYYKRKYNVHHFTIHSQE